MSFMFVIYCYQHFFFGSNYRSVNFSEGTVLCSNEIVLFTLGKDRETFVTLFVVNFTISCSMSGDCYDYQFVAKFQVWTTD